MAPLAVKPSAKPRPLLPAPAGGGEGAGAAALESKLSLITGHLSRYGVAEAELDRAFEAASERVYTLLEVRWGGGGGGCGVDTSPN